MDVPDTEGQPGGTPGTRAPLPEDVAIILKDALPDVAEEVISAIRREVGAYSRPLEGRFGQGIRRGVEIALGRFLDLAVGEGAQSSSPEMSEALEIAAALGRGEAQAGRSLEALLSAYRIGARASWRGFGVRAVEADLAGKAVVELAESVFTYIDELSAASIAAHASEQSWAAGEQSRRRAALARLLVVGSSPDILTEAARSAGWQPSSTLTAVLVANAQAIIVRSLLDEKVLLASVARQSDEDQADSGPDMVGSSPFLPGLSETDRRDSVLLVPDVDWTGLQRLKELLAGRGAVIGPTRHWTDVSTSHHRARRAAALMESGVLPLSDPLVADDHLGVLIVSADADCLADLRAVVLARLGELEESSRLRLEETLRSWLRNQGRRAEVAAELHVHPQTVRYRVAQLRDLYGSDLDDPDYRTDLLLALL